jgi:hypothetical protein
LYPDISASPFRNIRTRLKKKNPSTRLSGDGFDFQSG